MSKEIALPFPIKGYDVNGAYSAQAALTTGNCFNVRGYSADEERARGGSRPGVRRAYTQQIGGGAVPAQWLGWLDWGFGDAVFYDEGFAYDDGLLRDNAAWSAAGQDLKVSGGSVHLAGGTLPYVDVSSGQYQSFAGDTWDDFALEAGLSWGYGTSGSVTFWVSSSGGSPTDGARVTVSLASEWIASPGLGFAATLTITLESGAARQVYSRRMGVFVSELGGALRVEADAGAVRAYWNGAMVTSVARDDGTCSQAGFQLSMSKPSGSPLTDSMVDFRLLNWKLAAATRPVGTNRKLVAVAGRRVWAESAEGTLGTSAEDTLTLADVPLYSAAHCNGRLFLVDGAAPVLYNPMAATDKVTPWTARKGRLDGSCRIVVNWRNRLVLARGAADPQEFTLSRQDNPWDFDFGLADPQSASTASLSDSGRVADPITALCPLGDDVLVIGCTRSVWALRGDPLAGGRAVCLSDQTGILCQSAWSTDPEGNLYFLGEEGLFVCTPMGKPKNLTAARIPALTGVTPVHPGAAGASGQTFVTLVYDADRHGLLIFLTPYTSGAAVHYFYDLRNDAFWPESYPAAAGPACAAFYNSQTAAGRKLLLGGRGGYLLQYDESAKSDNVAGSDAAIASHVWIGPMRLGGGVRDAVVTRCVGVLSSLSDPAAWALHSAATPEAVLSSAAAASGTWSAGRNAGRSRVRGGAHAVKISNAIAARRWALESLVIEMEPGGVQR